MSLRVIIIQKSVGCISRACRLKAGSSLRGYLHRVCFGPVKLRNLLWRVGPFWFGLGVLNHAEMAARSSQAVAIGIAEFLAPGRSRHQGRMPVRTKYCESRQLSAFRRALRLLARLAQLFDYLHLRNLLLGRFCLALGLGLD